MIINLMDPALRVAAGHHLDLDLDIARSLMRAGHDVHVYSHVDVERTPQQMFSAHAGLTPIFRVTPYDGGSDGAGDGEELARFIREAELLAADLRKARPAELWI